MQSPLGGHGAEGGAGGRARREFSILTALWKKLSFSLLLLAWRHCGLLPDRSRLKRMCDGWVGSLAMQRALQVRQVQKMSWMGERHQQSPQLLFLGFTTVRRAGAVPHHDRAGQCDLLVESLHDEGPGPRNAVLLSIQHHHLWSEECAGCVLSQSPQQSP